VDLETGAIVAAEVYSAEHADPATLRPSLETARDNVDAARAESPREESNDDDDGPPPAAPTSDTRTTIAVVADKGYHKVELLHESGARSIERTFPCPTRRASVASRTRVECSRAKRFTTIERACVETRARSCFGYAAN
jgi:hypothetical protein